MFYYDYLLTIPDEVRLVWGRPFNLATAIFLYLRYAILIQASLDVVNNVNLTSTSTVHLTAGRFVYHTLMTIVAATHAHRC